MNNKLVAGILILIFITGAAATITAPSKWGQGYKLYSTYWNFMGSYLDNASLSNVTNMTINPMNTSAYATATVFFNYSSPNRTLILYAKTINVSLEKYSFNNSKGYRIVNLTGNQNLSYACTQFVNEVNTNSSNFTASTCVSNTTTLTSKYLGTPSNGFTLTTNETNITIPATFSSGADYTPFYVDITAPYNENASTSDMIFRSWNATGVLTERFRIRQNVAPGNATIFKEITIPTVRPSSPVNGSFVLNLSENLTEVYSNGRWHNTGNGSTRN